jgi:hypothetical protein
VTGAAPLDRPVRTAFINCAVAGSGSRSVAPALQSFELHRCANGVVSGQVRLEDQPPGALMPRREIEGAPRDRDGVARVRRRSRTARVAAQIQRSSRDRSRSAQFKRCAARRAEVGKKSRCSTGVRARIVGVE